MFNRVISKATYSAKKKCTNMVIRPPPIKSSVPASLYEVNIRSLKNILESIRTIKNR